jgi:hypothetical protein
MPSLSAIAKSSISFTLNVTLPVRKTGSTDPLMLSYVEPKQIVRLSRLALQLSQTSIQLLPKTGPHLGWETIADFAHPSAGISARIPQRKQETPCGRS